MTVAPERRWHTGALPPSRGCWAACDRLGRIAHALGLAERAGIRIGFREFMATGMRVRARWAAETKGSIGDFVFEPA